MHYRINELKIGLKVIQNREPCTIISNEQIKPGKGQAFNRVRFKQIVSGKILEKTLKSGDFLESADIVETKLVYVYKDKDLWYFMDEKSFEQTVIHVDILKNSIPWIIEQLNYVVTFWNKVPILVTAPVIIELKVIKIIAIGNNVSVSSGNKLAVLSTGAVVKVPIFVQLGEIIKVNTNLGTYISRVK